MSTTETDYIFDTLYEHTKDYIEERMNDIMGDLKEDFHVSEDVSRKLFYSFLENKYNVKHSLPNYDNTIDKLNKLTIVKNNKESV